MRIIQSSWPETLRILQSAPWVGVDIETTTKDPRTGSISIITFVVDDNLGNPSTFISDFMPPVEDLQFLTKSLIAAFNSAYESIWFWAKLGLRLNILSDPYVGTRLFQLKQASQKDLVESIQPGSSQIRLIDVFPDLHDTYHFNWDLNNPLHLQYCEGDGAALHAAHTYISHMATTKNCLPLYELESWTAAYMAIMGYEGYQIDMSQYPTQFREVEQNLNSLEQAFWVALDEHLVTSRV